jgi:hypothetical protein
MPAHPVGDAPPHRHGEELHQRITGSQGGGDEIAGAQIARHAGQKWDDEPEPDQVQKDGQKKGAK